MLKFIIDNAVFFQVFCLLMHLSFLFKSYKTYYFWKKNINVWEKMFDDCVRLVEEAKIEKQKYLDLQKKLEKIILDKNSNM